LVFVPFVMMINMSHRETINFHKVCTKSRTNGSIVVIINLIGVGSINSWMKNLFCSQLITAMLMCSTF